MLTVRQAHTSDIGIIAGIFNSARKFMAASGNATQWIDGYPTSEIVLRDIANGNCYIVMQGEAIAGVFTFIVGREPNYDDIMGLWPDNKPYGTIHRLASAGISRGIADCALDFCLKAGVNIRIDTHADNSPMLKWIETRGFRYCGIIKVENGTPRVAFALDYESAEPAFD